MMPSVKRQRWTVGAVVRIPLDDGSHSYAQMLNDPEYAFFDLRTTEDVTVDEIVKLPVAFRLWVMRNAHSSGRWMKIGNASISEPLNQPVLRFNQDALKLSNIRLSYDGCGGDPCTIDECQQFECAAVWEPNHVEDRLRDHFNDVPNVWVESLRPKPFDM